MNCQYNKFSYYLPVKTWNGTTWKFQRFQSLDSFACYEYIYVNCEFCFSSSLGQLNKINLFLKNLVVVRPFLVFIFYCYCRNDRNTFIHGVWIFRHSNYTCHPKFLICVKEINTSRNNVPYWKNLKRFDSGYRYNEIWVTQKIIRYAVYTKITITELKTYWNEINPFTFFANEANFVMIFPAGRLTSSWSSADQKTWK